MSPSTFTWLQFDDEQARRARELVRALSEPGTLDSLGIGTIRDGFANILLPGTSTIQTRARYFLLVPWAVRLVEASRPSSRANYDNRLREIEVATIDALKLGEPSARGIIGVERGRKTRNLASTVYWSGLATWGIRAAADLTRADVRDVTLAPRPSRRNDDGESTPLAIWDDIPDPPSGFPDEPLSILPTPEEADYLLSKMATTRSRTVMDKVQNAPGRPTLLAEVARSPQTAGAEHIWDIPNALLGDELTALVELAHGFATAIQGARLRYLDLLFERKATMGGEPLAGRAELNVHIAAWLAEMSRDEARMHAWRARIPEMFELLAEYGVTVRPSTRDFVATWSTAAVEDAPAALASSALADLITDREARLKKLSARLTHDSPLHAWNGELLGIDQLDFRWGVARGHILDCLEGKEAGHAQS